MLTHCILCGQEAKLTIRLEDFDTILCPECDSEFSVADIDQRIEQLTALARVCKAARGAMETVNA